jgi:hypothetical protein
MEILRPAHTPCEGASSGAGRTPPDPVRLRLERSGSRIRKLNRLLNVVYILLHVDLVDLVDIGGQRREARVGHRALASVWELGGCQERYRRAEEIQVGLSHLGHRGGFSRLVFIDDEQREAIASSDSLCSTLYCQDIAEASSKTVHTSVCRLDMKQDARRCSARGMDPGEDYRCRRNAANYGPSLLRPPVLQLDDGRVHA